MPSARTWVPTERAGRYLVQVCEHLDRLAHGRGHAGPGVQGVEWSDTHGRIVLAAGQCELSASADGLDLVVTAADDAALRHLQQTLTARLETIGRRDHLVVAW